VAKKTEQGILLSEGEPCPVCGAALRVEEDRGPTTFKSAEGEAIIDATYQCEGAERHQLDAYFDFSFGGPENAKYRLVRVPSKASDD